MSECPYYILVLIHFKAFFLFLMIKMSSFFLMSRYYQFKEYTVPQKSFMHCRYLHIHYFYIVDLKSSGFMNENWPPFNLNKLAEKAAKKDAISFPSAIIWILVKHFCHHEHHFNRYLDFVTKYNIFYLMLNSFKYYL